jgi:apolipoprotein N-acyltransferase
MNYRYYHSDDVPPEKYNTALLVAPNGQVAGHYHKMHLLPFGEFIPFAEVFPWMVRLTPYDATYSCVPGKEATRLAVGRHRFGVVICYEDADPPLARQYVDPVAGPRADFLVNISNDGWFKGSCEHEQHLAICRFRAIECRRSVVRSVNMGISGVIDANGRVLAPRQLEHRPDDSRIWDISWDDRKQELPVQRWGEFKKVSGVLLAVVPLDQRSTLYASWGEWVPLGCWVALGLLLVLALIRRWRPGEGVSTS